MRQLSDKIVEEAQAATVNGPAIQCDGLNKLSMHAKITGAATTGVMKIQASNQLTAPTAATEWFDVTSATVNITAVGSYGVGVADWSYKWARAVYTQAAGTGTLTIWVHGKGA